MVICPSVTWSGGRPRSSAISGRRSLLVNPLGCSRSNGRAARSAWLRRWPRRRPGIRAPVGVVTGSVTTRRAVMPVIGSWLSFWTRSRPLRAHQRAGGASLAAGVDDEPFPVGTRSVSPAPYLPRASRLDTNRLPTSRTRQARPT